MNLSARPLRTAAIALLVGLLVGLGVALVQHRDALAGSLRALTGTEAEPATSVTDAPRAAAAGTAAPATPAPTAAPEPEELADAGATEPSPEADATDETDAPDEAAWDGPITIAFGGDVNGEPPILQQLLAGAPIFDDLATVFEPADLAMVNLETAVGTAGSPADKQFTFQAPEELVVGLRDAGVDVVSLANNHALDYGPEAMLETIELAEAAGLQVVGAGVDAAAAYAPALVDIRGVRIAVVGLTRVYPVVEWAATEDRPGMANAYDEDAAVAAVEAAAEQADRVVVMIHWGRELAQCPADHQLSLADRLTAAGADVVAGHHPHVLQGIEEINGGTVAFSLGNLVFPSFREETRATGLLVATLTEDATAHELVPARIDDRGSPRLLEGDAATAALARVDSLSLGGGICPPRP
jgi:poly-gamma-glutamate capsule biosynthesis protein CapA/YwtB (metallophosphatase superfamily)